MLAAPPDSPYDLKFRLFDIPVRVNPWFWLLMLMFSNSQKGNLTPALIWMAVAFVSILVHEFGHGLVGRATGAEPMEIVLYSMGGLCYSDHRNQTQFGRFLTIAAGPGAGFAFLAVVLAIAKMSYGIEPMDLLALFGIGNGDFDNVRILLRDSPPAFYMLADLVFINLVWGVLNLFPIWPLDGGQMLEIILGRINRRKATQWTNVISLLTAGSLAVWFASRQPPEWYRAILFGYFAFGNYRRLQELHEISKYADHDRW